MKRRLLFNTQYLLPMLMMALSFAACSDDDDNIGGENSANSHIGQWFLDQSSPGKILWSEMSLDAMGNYSRNLIISSRKEAMNHRMKSKTTYYREGNTLVCQEDFSSTGGGISTERYDIIYVDKYTFTWSYAKDGSTETYNRIVDEYYVQVGDSIPFGFNDREFANANYHSTDERIAQVNDTGCITAIQHGTTYITANSEDKAATIKIHVIDSENPFKEYGDDLTLTKKQIIKKYGDDYDEFPYINSIVYYMGNMDTKAVCFMFTSHHKVHDILIEHWDNSYIAELTEYFEGKYKHVGKEDNGSNIFRNSDGKCSYNIFTDINDCTSGYKRELSDFELCDDWVNNYSADELAAKFGYTITEEDLPIIKLPVENNDLYKNIKITYNEVTRATIMVIFTLKDGVSTEKATELVQEFYPYYNPLGYCTNSDIRYLYPPIFVKVARDKKTDEVLIQYTRF